LGISSPQFCKSLQAAFAPVPLFYFCVNRFVWFFSPKTSSPPPCYSLARSQKTSSLTWPFFLQLPVSRDSLWDFLFSLGLRPLGDPHFSLFIQPTPGLMVFLCPPLLPETCSASRLVTLAVALEDGGRGGAFFLCGRLPPLLAS